MSHSFGEPQWGGAERQALRLGLELQRRGHHVLHLTSGEHEGTVRVSGLDVARIRGTGSSRLLSIWLRYAPALRSWLKGRGQEFDVWHVHGAFDPTGVIAGSCSGPPKVLKHASAREYEKLWMIARVPRALATRVHAGYEAHVSNNPEILASAQTSMPETAVFEAIPNGVELPKSVADDGALRQRLGLSPSDQIVSHVGSFLRAKNQRLLVEAAARVADTHFVFAGGGPQKKHCEARAAELGLQARLHFLGPVDDVATILRGSQVFAFPSVSEGMPNALLEAMSFALPSVVTKIPALTALVRDGEEGHAVEPDPESFARALRSMLDDDSSRRRLGRAAQRRVETTFSMQVVGERYLELYRQLCRR